MEFSHFQHLKLHKVENSLFSNVGYWRIQFSLTVKFNLQIFELANDEVVVTNAFF